MIKKVDFMFSCNIAFCQSCDVSHVMTINSRIPIVYQHNGYLDRTHQHFQV